MIELLPKAEWKFDSKTSLWQVYIPSGEIISPFRPIVFFM